MTQKPNPIPVRPRAENPSVHFEKAAWSVLHAEANGHDRFADVFPDDRVVPILLRTAIAPASTTVSGWAAELAEHTTGAFLGSLGPQSAASTLISLGVEIDLQAGQTTLPGRAGAPSRLPFVGEGAPIPVSRQTVTGTNVGPKKKMGVIVVFSHELAKRAAAQPVFTALLRESAAASLDAGYFSTSAGDDINHAGLLYGVTPVAPIGRMKDDLAALALTVGTGGSGQVVFVTGPGRAAAISVYAPDFKLPVLPSLAVPEDRVIAIDPLSLAHAVGTDPDISASTSALLHMDDAPAQIVSGSTAAPVRSLYQTASIALSCIIEIAFAPRRSAAVAYMDGISGWGSST